MLTVFLLACMTMIIQHKNNPNPLQSDLNDTVPWTFYIEGVRCSKCIQKLESLPNENAFFKEARFHKGSSTLELTIDEHPITSSLNLSDENKSVNANKSSKLTPEDTIQMIESKGYKAYFITQKSEITKQRMKEQRDWLIRLAITFFFAANIMMFTASLYTGAENIWKTLFSYLSGVFYIPIFIYSAMPFYRNAWQGIKDRQFTADLAVAIAFVWGSVFSYFNLIRGNDAFYFDSSATFIFLILLARFVLYKAQQSIESDLNPSLLFKSNPFYNITRNQQNLRLRFDQIQKGDLVQIEQNQLLPVDGVLACEKTEIDTSIFSGEAIPQVLQQYQDVKAGMIVLSTNTTVETQKIFEESELYYLFEGVLKNRQIKTKSHTQAEIYSQRLLKIVTALSILLFLYLGVLQGEWNEGFTRALALFTIACPCALALAIPLASVTTLKRAVTFGIIAKTPLVFEKLQEVENVVFDKTGTLTEGRLEFEGYLPIQPKSEILQILLGLEEPSHHPLAKSLTQKLKTEGYKPAMIENRKEIVGVGVSGTIDGNLYEIKRLQEITPQSPDSTGFSLYKNGNLALSVFFKDKVRDEAQSMIRWLKNKKLNVQIFSGDRNSVVQDVAHKLNLNPSQVFAHMSPQEKSEKMKAQKTLMIGDGHNDSLALSSAYASMAVSGSAETSLQAADCYSQHLGITGLPVLFDLSHFYLRLIRQNIILSLGYNFIAGTIAILGYINPLTAALLMPINSLVVITATALAKPKLSAHSISFQKKLTQLKESTELNLSFDQSLSDKQEGLAEWKHSTL